MLNHITLMGRLVKDPELRHTSNGIAVASFTIAVTRDYNKAETGAEADFIDIVAWRSTAEFISNYFSKGRMIVVSGRLQIRAWKDSNGNNRKSAEVIADNVYFGDSKKVQEGTEKVQIQERTEEVSDKESKPEQLAYGKWAEEDDDYELPF